MGRNAVGVWGIRPETDDEVIAIAHVLADATLLVAGENGIGKRTGFDEYRIQSRGGKGIITMRTGDRTGTVVGALTVRDSDQVMLITTGGQMVRIRVSEIREAGRNTMGVKLINLIEGEKSTILELKVAEGDIGKVIGKHGRIAKAVRTILSAAATKTGKRVVLEILD